jgi:hypothetical protein
MTLPEAKFSREFSNELKKYDLFSFRIESSHTCPGLPDWCILYQGKVIFVELKYGAGRLTPAQVIVHRTFKNVKVPIHILRRTTNGVIIDSTVEVATVKEAIDWLLEAS